MAVCEINFDGLIGPSHNYGGLSRGNLASTAHATMISTPRAAALQGLAKMRALLALGLPQGLLLPHLRPNDAWLGALGCARSEPPPHLRAAAWSASAMWAANAATVSPAADCADGRAHLTVANLVTMAHRGQEWPETERQLRLAFPAANGFAVHGPVPPSFGDEGAANHMRLTPPGASHGAAGVEIFVSGRCGGRFPARQHSEAGRAIARRHGLDPARTLFIEQSSQAVDAGAFHNDVVAVANGHVLLAHEQAFADAAGLYAQLEDRIPGVAIIEVPAAEVSLSDAVASYLFNAQLVTLPGDAGMALILPTEASATPSVKNWLDRLMAGNGSIRQCRFVDVRQSMANGGGPACLRLRVVADPASVDSRFLLDSARLDSVAELVERHWPERIAPIDLGDPGLVRDVIAARQALFDHLGIPAS